MNQRVLDVSGLSHAPADSRALIWWGNLAMMAIEGTVFAMAIATFLYLRMKNLDWPPATVPKPDMLLPIVNLVLLILSGLPALMSDAAARKEDLTAVRIGMALFILAGIVNIFLRSSAMEFVLSCCGVLVFAGLTAYDTQRIRAMAEQGEDKHALVGALSLYLDFINLFLFLLRIFGDRRR